MRLLILFAAAASSWAQITISGGGAAGGLSFGTSTPGSCIEGKSPLFYNTTSHTLLYCGSGNTYVTVVGGGGGATGFANVTGGTNTNALLVGTGGSLAATGSGAISATQLNGVNVPVSATVLGTNSGGQGVAQKGQAIEALSYPSLKYVVDGTTYAGIASAYNACAAVIGSGAGTCDIYDWNLPHSLNTMPWKVDHTEKIIVHLHLGPGVLTICDAGTDPDGNTCPSGSAFSFGTGNGGWIEGVATSLATSDTGSIIRAGANLLPANWPNGTVNTSGTTMSWVSGSTFNTTGWKDFRVKINSSYFTISSCASTTTCTLTTSPGTLTGATFTVGLAGVMVAWGDSINTDRQDAFGSVIRNVLIDANCNAGLIGVANTSTQELSDIDNVRIKNFDTIGFWSSSIRASNAHIGLLDVIPSGNGKSCLKASTIPVLIANSGSPRPQGGMTINGLNGYNVTLNGASLSWSANVGTITGLSFLQANINTAQGPNGSATYVYLNDSTDFTSGTAGWAGTWPVASVTGCAAGTCTGMTLTMTGATNVGNVTGTAGTVSLVPTYLAVLVGGTAAGNYYSGDTSSGGQTIEMSGVHMQHSGIGIQIDSSSAQSIRITDISGSSDMNTVVNIASAATLRDITLYNLNGGGAKINIVDNNTSPVVSKSNQYIGQYATGSQPGGTSGGPLFQWSTPLTLTEVAAPATSTHCVAGIDTIYGDSTAHRPKICSNAGSFVQLAQSGGDISTTDTVTGTNGATLPVSALSTATNSSGQIVAGTTAALAQGICSGTITNLGTVFMFAFGQVAGTGCTQTTATVGYTFAIAHTVKNLAVRAGTASTTVGTGQITILKNGSAFSPSITCTLGTANNCSDVTHSGTVSAGDRIQAQAISAGGTLTAGPTYSSGASACTNGTQTVTFTNNTSGINPVGATGTITVSGNVPTGAVTISTGGAGYTAATPPTQGSVATCTGTATFTGGTVTVDGLNTISVTVEVQ